VNVVFLRNTAHINYDEINNERKFVLTIVFWCGIQTDLMFKILHCHVTPNNSTVAQKLHEAQYYLEKFLYIKTQPSVTLHTDTL